MIDRAFPGRSRLQGPYHGSIPCPGATLARGNLAELAALINTARWLTCCDLALSRFFNAIGGRREIWRIGRSFSRMRTSCSKG